MDCTYFQELLSAMKDGELGKDEELKLADHLRACPACRKFATELAETSQILSHVESEAMPSEVEDRILNATVRSPRGPVEQTGFWRGTYVVPKKLAWAIAAVLALLIINSGVQIMQREKAEQLPESIRGTQPAVQHIVLSEADVVSSYSRLNPDKN